MRAVIGDGMLSISRRYRLKALRSINTETRCNKEIEGEGFSLPRIRSTSCLSSRTRALLGRAGENAFRRFESSLSEQLGSALQATRRAMCIAIERRTARIEEIDEYVKKSTRAIASINHGHGPKTCKLASPSAMSRRR